MEKKKFKLNVIDIIVIALIICVGIFIAMKFYDGGMKAATTYDLVRVTFYQEECADFVISQTKTGDALYDGTAELSLGSVTDIRTDKSQTYSILEDGTVVLAPKENYSSVYISGEVYGTLCPNGVIINDTLYSVGHSLVLHAGYGKYYIKVFSIEKVS